jgi:hypothetical protein
VNPLRWWRARREARLNAEITAVWVEARAVLAEQRSRETAGHDLLDTPTTR